MQSSGAHSFDRVQGAPSGFDAMHLWTHRKFVVSHVLWGQSVSVLQ
jgi:hypothetical protein